MKTVQVNAASVVAVVLGVGVTCAAAGAFLGYSHGYKQGDFDASHEASRLATSNLAELMTSGIAVAQPDGTAKIYVLKPVEVFGRRQQP